MTFATYPSTRIRLENDRISRDDALRQEKAAIEVLRRLERQPGVVLADEVGMGKTFVAMAVATSILLDRPKAGPIVVMVPPSLRQKWPSDWAVFKEKCLLDEPSGGLRAASAETGVGFLKLLDDPPDRQCHLVFLTHGALHRAIGDPWAKLAVIKRAFQGRSSLAAQRSAFGKFAGKLLQLGKVDRRTDGLPGELLERPYEDWLRLMHRADDRLRQTVTDDPVPKHLADALESMHGRELNDVVKGLRRLPLRDSVFLDDRILEARRSIAAALKDVWKVALRRSAFRSPLLILDEAHHVKNPATRLASLFATEESVEDSAYFTYAGALGGKFERMLFLTATPFQLGHAELIHVLERFEGISWEGKRAPRLTLPEYRTELRSLASSLDDGQAAALRLDRSWGKLDRDILTKKDESTLSVDEWWRAAQTSDGDGVVAEVVAQVEKTRQAMEIAEKALAPWVLRYVRLPSLPDHPSVQRRILLPGAAIRDGGLVTSGLEIGPQVTLPFLLAGRAQVLFANSTRGRALFAEGLASSFEAYLETRSGKDNAVDEDGDLVPSEAVPELEWYLRHLDRALPSRDRHMRSAHPKVEATAERAVALWSAGEKVLIFCHYRATGRALRQHISALLHEEIIRLGQSKLPGLSDEAIERRIDAIGNRFFDEKDALKGVVTEWLDGIVGRWSNLSKDQRDKVVDVVRRFIRTPSFLVRYLPIQATNLAKVFVSVVEDPGPGRPSLRQNVEHFCEFLDRCIDSERDSYITALDKVQTGTHAGKELRGRFDPAERTRGRQGILLPNVRLANGEVRSDTRQRLLRTFNTPLFPEILIASSVMAEGVDLHLNCRYVIHHDLSWNPSTLEQRSGRVDRIGCKAERVGQSIHVYMPYVAATQDEKMYRVVRDRERWFQIVMGEKYQVDEAATDRQAERIPLPESVRTELAMSLHPE